VGELEQLTALLLHMVQSFEKAENEKNEIAEANSERGFGLLPNLRRTDS
jgi:hypothetical protein